MNDTNRLNPVLVMGDVIAFLVFALAGIRSHEEGASAATLLRVIAPFLGAWLPVAYILGLFRHRPVESVDEVAPRLIKAWLPAWAIGLAIRSLIFGRAFAPTFAVISFLVNLALLAGWRAAYTYMQRRAERHA